MAGGAHRGGGRPLHGRHAARWVLPAWLRRPRRRRLPRQLALGLLEDAMGRMQDGTAAGGDEREAG